MAQFTSGKLIRLHVFNCSVKIHVGLTRLHDSYILWYLYICHSLSNSQPFFASHMFMKITLRCVNIRGNFILSRVEPLYCTIMIANCMLLCQGWHLCNSFVMSLKHCLWLISIARYASKSLVLISFRGTISYLSLSGFSLEMP